MENKMTPAPWKIDQDGYVRGSNPKQWIFSVPADVDSDNAAAIVSAVNNTYGAGINPEAVPELLKAAELAVSALLSTEQGYNELRAAIEKAKL